MTIKNKRALFYLSLCVFVVGMVWGLTAQAATWECIHYSFGCNTWRMSIPNGWIVASDNSAGGGQHGYAMVYVPDINHEWKL